MRRLLSWPLAAVLWCVLASAIASAAQPDPYRLLLYTLLGLDQQELFEPQEYTPLNELNAWSDLHAALLAQARTDHSQDRRHLKGFLFMGWVARSSGQFASVEAFNTDLMEIFEARPADVLQVLGEHDFLIEETCRYLAGFFFFEDGDPNGRAPFMDRHRDAFERVLGADQAHRCFEVFWRVSE